MGDPPIPRVGVRRADRRSPVPGRPVTPRRPGPPRRPESSRGPTAQGAAAAGPYRCRADAGARVHRRPLRGSSPAANAAPAPQRARGWTGRLRRHAANPTD